LGDRISRRALVLGALLGSTAIASAAWARTIKGIPWTPGAPQLAPRGFDAARFFTDAERRCVDAIVARLIPSDDRGPGAREANVVGFIDNQLAGFYGRGQRWYMQGPFPEGGDTQDYQSEHAPAQLYRNAIAALDEHCRQTANGRRFAELPENEQDDLLKRMEEGELKLPGVPAKTFFKIVLENAIEGFFCDPLYGGNRDMVGWRLVGFPGARYDYRDFLAHDGAPIAIEPVGLMGRPAWNAG
jgi:gluconate 2-dehydrogenase gamma chain